MAACRVLGTFHLGLEPRARVQQSREEQVLFPLHTLPSRVFLQPTPTSVPTPLLPGKTGDQVRKCSTWKGTAFIGCLSCAGPNTEVSTFVSPQNHPVKWEGPIASDLREWKSPRGENANRTGALGLSGSKFKI